MEQILISHTASISDVLKEILNINTGDWFLK